MLVADERDLADVDLRPFLDHERDADLGRRNRTYFGAHRRELPAMLRQQFPDRDFCLLNLGGIVLALGGKPDLALLKTIEHVAFRNRVQSEILNFADGRPLLDVNMDTPALGGLFFLEPYVLEVVSVPQGVEIAVERRLVINIPGTGENTSAHRVRRDAPVSVDDDLSNDFLLAPARRPQQNQQEAHKRPSQFTNLYD